MAIDLEAEGDETDRYVRKNMALSRAYDIERKDKLRAKQAKGEIKPILTTCYRCKKEEMCLPFQITETGRFDGVVSVSKEMVQLCVACAPKPRKGASEMSKKQINALLRGVKKGRL